ncbi:O-antigen ligase family protein [candidate division KSB1 bacterium]|nr:O-antigen ligase family protein [candidate division KSB1 bacterium]
MLTPANVNNNHLFYLLPVEISLVILTAIDMKITAIVATAIIFAILFFYVIEKESFYSIPVVLFAILGGNFSSLPFGKKMPNIYFNDILFLLILLIFLLRYFLTLEKFKFKFSPMVFVFFLFIISCLLSNLQSVDVLRGLAYLRGHIFAWLLFVFCLAFIEIRKQIHLLINLLMVWGALLSIIQIIHIWLKGDIIMTIITKDIHLGWASSNYIAAFYVLLIPIGISLVLAKIPAFYRLFLIITVLLMISALFLTASRGGVVALFAAFPVLLWRYKNWKTFIAFLVFAVVIAVAIFLNPSTTVIWEGLVNFDTSSSVFSRVGTWIEAWRIFKAHPVLGVGIGCMHYFTKNYYVLMTGNFELVKAHNLILELLVENGIIGALLFSILIFFIIRTLYKNCYFFPKSFDSSLAWGMAAGIIAAFVHSMVEPTILNYSFGLLFWAVIAMTVLHTNVKES